MRFYSILIFALALIFLAGCTDTGTDPLDISYERGDLVEVQSRVTMTSTFILLAVRSFAPDLSTDYLPQNSIEIISVVYKTVDPAGNLVDASGVVIIPLIEDNAPLISLHHGTQSRRTSVGSVEFQYAFEGIIAASAGYVASVPDYLGLGVSNILHPYLHEETSASSSLDMLLAAKQFCEENNIELNDQLFLGGYSQGGFVTMALHKELETNYSDLFSVTASAPMAGPHDLLGTALFITQGETYPSPSFISFLALAYNDIYGWDRLDEIFESPFNNTIPVLFNGALSTWEIDNSIPNNLDELFRDSFIEDLRNNPDNYFRNALIDNSPLNWGPRAPVTIIHGDADTYVPFQNATSARSNLLLNGASSVEIVVIEGGDHGSSVLPAIEYTLNWFNSFRDQSLPKLRLSNLTAKQVK
jgi:pimeloyl-ACP methyl ester carboxylesterase